MPHAWRAGEQTTLLRRQLEAMEDGGLVVMSAPANPFRCPPGPYERASLIAHYLKTQKAEVEAASCSTPRTQFSKQRLFQNAWKELYPNHLEWVSLSKGGKVTSVDPATKTLTTDFGKHVRQGRQRDPAAEGRPHRRARGRHQPAPAGARSIRMTFELTQVPNIHVVGDATIAGAMPKSGFIANSQAKVCADAIAKLLAGETPSPAEADQHLLQPGGARLRHLGRRRLSHREQRA